MKNMTTKKDIDGQIARLARNLLSHQQSSRIEYEINNAYGVTNIDIKQAFSIEERITIPTNNKSNLYGCLVAINQFLEFKDRLITEDKT